MALLRLLSSPSQLHFSTTHVSPNFSPLQKSLSPILSPFSTISLHTPCSSFLPIKPQRPYIYTFRCSSETQHEQSVEEEGSGTRVLAQNVPWTSTADDLRPLFEKFGTVLDIEVSMYNKTRSRGLVFVTMGSHEEAKAVVKNLEAYELEGRPLRLAWAKPKANNRPSSSQKFKPKPIHNLFVANLHFEVRSNDLMEFFKDNGASVVSAEVIFNDNPRRSAGYGFVSFNTEGDAEAALSSLQGKELMGRPVRVARSKRFLRGETKKKLESQELQSELVSVAE